MFLLFPIATTLIGHALFNLDNVEKSHVLARLLASQKCNDTNTPACGIQIEAYWVDMLGAKYQHSYVTNVKSIVSEQTCGGGHILLGEAV